MTRADIYKKYFGYGVSQDPVKSFVVRAFCSIVDKSPGYEIWYNDLSDETVASVLDSNDFSIWLSNKPKQLAG